MLLRRRIASLLGVALLERMSVECVTVVPEGGRQGLHSREQVRDSREQARRIQGQAGNHPEAGRPEENVNVHRRSPDSPNLRVASLRRILRRIGLRRAVRRRVAALRGEGEAHQGGR